MVLFLVLVKARSAKLNRQMLSVWSPGSGLLFPLLGQGEGMFTAKQLLVLHLLSISFLHVSFIYPIDLLSVVSVLFVMAFSWS